MTARVLLPTALICLAVTTVFGRSASRSIAVDGRARTFVLHVPENLPRDRPVPLLLVFHGGGGQGLGTERFTRFSPIADREQFIVAYPDGLNRSWNDGRNAPGLFGRRDHVDDIAFVTALTDSLTREFSIDPKRIFATGISNGGMFSHYLATRLSQRIAAIAPVVGGLAEDVALAFKVDSPVSVFIIQGTADPLVPYDGGPIARQARGRIVSTNEAVRRWVATDGCKSPPRTGYLPDRDPSDGCRVNWFTWTGGRDTAEVTLYRIEGGGHTWPGGPQYLPQRFIGNVCRDFDASEVIWDFFKRHPKP
ncbi:hypothetical protein AYO41_04535 [Verrucomicrobia bacterium SCGC AG-212-E04]|nr:hypothetical protein AYO41_04535 [Verrucomicrobia bacterium SCGC AG-212-E04]